MVYINMTIEEFDCWSKKIKSATKIKYDLNKLKTARDEASQTNKWSYDIFRSTLCIGQGEFSAVTQEEIAPLLVELFNKLIKKRIEELEKL